MIICKESIKIGDDCLISQGTQIMDTDLYPIYDAHGNRMNNERSIVIGNHCWIGCKCNLLKGTQLFNNTVVAAGSTGSLKCKQKNV